MNNADCDRDHRLPSRGSTISKPKSQVSPSKFPGNHRDSQDGVRSLDRALSILEVIAGSPGGITLSCLATALNLPLTTTHRLLTTLEGRSFVAIDQRRKLWRIGRMAASVGANFMATRDLVAIARPIMHSAAARISEVLNLGVIADGKVVFVYRVDPRSRLPFAPTGKALPVHCTSIGKALLAFSSRVEIEHVAEAPLKQLTPHTITSREAFIDDLQRARATGYATDSEENSLGLKCIAAPVFDEHKYPVAALSIAQTTSSAQASSAVIIGELARSIASQITRAYGGTPLSTGTRRNAA